MQRLSSHHRPVSCSVTSPEPGVSSLTTPVPGSHPLISQVVTTTSHDSPHSSPSSSSASLLSTAAVATPSQVQDWSPAAETPDVSVETPGVPLDNDVDDSSTLDEVDVTHLLVMKKSVSYYSACISAYVPFNALTLLVPEHEGCLAL